MTLAFQLFLTPVSTFLFSLLPSHSVQNAAHDFGEFSGQQGGNGIPDLGVLFGAVASKEIVVWKGLQTRSFPDSETPALRRVVMNVIVAILGNVSNHSGCRFISTLNPEAIIEWHGLVFAQNMDIDMVR